MFFFIHLWSDSKQFLHFFVKIKICNSELMELDVQLKKSYFFYMSSKKLAFYFLF
jgi:hypothetical protein